MKRVVMSALAVTLLCGTSALAQEGGAIARMARDAVARSQAQAQQRTEAPQPAAAQPAAERSRGDRGGREDGQRQGGGGRPDRGPSQAPVAVAPQAQAPAAASSSGRGGQWAQAQRRPDGQSDRQRGDRPDRTDRQRGERPDRGTSQPQFTGDRQTAAQIAGWTEQARREEQRERDRDRRRDRYDRDYRDQNPGWDRDRDRDRYDRDRYDRPPVIRPEDRRDRDRNRPRYDQRRYPHYVTPQQRYRWRGSIYRPPVGFYSYRWQFGQTLPWNWYTPNYYLNDWWSYGLPMPPVGYEWVRLGDDAVLVDVFRGRIYQVVYNLFW